MTRAKHPPPWLFVLTGMPYGVVGSFSGQVMPYLMRDSGAEVGNIGWYGALLLVPTFLQFLYAPVVDLGPKRKQWLVIVAALGGACMVAACLMPLPGQANAFLAFAFLGQAISGLVGACNGGLLATTMPDGLRGKASGWLNIGNLSGGALSAWVVISEVNNEAEPIVIGLTIAAMMILPSLASLFVDEPDRVKREVFGPMLREVKAILTTKSGITGILLCLSPVGTAALSNYFSAMAVDYSATKGESAFLFGPSMAVLTAVGAWGGGWLCDRYNRRALYLASGTLTAIVGLAMMVSTRNHVTFVWGVMVYTLVTGFCYAAFTATVLETIGSSSEGASTRYSMFTAAGNAAITYTALIDSRFHERSGVEGVVGSDALLNIAGVLILAAVFWRLGAFGKRRHEVVEVSTEQAPAELPKATVVEKD